MAVWGRHVFVTFRRFTLILRVVDTWDECYFTRKQQMTSSLLNCKRRCFFHALIPFTIIRSSDVAAGVARNSAAVAGHQPTSRRDGFLNLTNDEDDGHVSSLASSTTKLHHRYQQHNNTQRAWSSLAAAAGQPGTSAGDGQRQNNADQKRVLELLQQQQLNMYTPRIHGSPCGYCHQRETAHPRY